MTEGDRPTTVIEDTDGDPQQPAGTGTAHAPGGRPPTRTHRGAGVVRERNDHDAATVLAIVLAMAGGDVGEQSTSEGPRSIWSDPAHRLGGLHPSAVAWWASAMPR